jgi:hypothetical protein
MPVILVNRVINKEKKYWEKWRAEEKEERHKGLLTLKKNIFGEKFLQLGLELQPFLQR